FRGGSAVQPELAPGLSRRVSMVFPLSVRPLAAFALLLSLTAIPALAAPRAVGSSTPTFRSFAGRCAGLAHDAVAGCFHGRVTKKAEGSAHDPKGGPKAPDPNSPSADYGPLQSSTIDPNGANGGLP